MRVAVLPSISDLTWKVGVKISLLAVDSKQFGNRIVPHGVGVWRIDRKPQG